MGGNVTRGKLSNSRFKGRGIEKIEEERGDGAGVLASYFIFDASLFEVSFCISPALSEALGYIIEIPELSQGRLVHADTMFQGRKKGQPVY